MRVTPISEEEADAQSSNLFPDGDYDFEVRDANEEISQAGRDMVKMEVWIYDASGSRRLVFDYLVEGEKSAWKVRRFAASCGLVPQFEKGALIASEIVGRTGRCKLGLQKATAEYPAKNVIRDYYKATSSSNKAAAASSGNVRVTRVKAPAGGGDIDDEIPFGVCWQ